MLDFQMAVLRTCLSDHFIIKLKGLLIPLMLWSLEGVVPFLSFFVIAMNGFP